VDDSKDYNHVVTLFKIGDLVRFVGYYYSPDYVYEDAENYEIGIIVDTMARYFYQPAYRVYWFKKKLITETVQEYLELVIIKKDD